MSPKTQGHFLFRKYQYSSTPVWLTAIGPPLIFKPSPRKGVSSPFLQGLRAHEITIAPLALSYICLSSLIIPHVPGWRASSKMNNCHPHPNYAWKLCGTMLVTKYQKSWLSNRFSPPFSYQLNMITLHQTKLIPLSYLCGYAQSAWQHLSACGNPWWNIREQEVSKKDDCCQFLKRAMFRIPQTREIY